MKKYILLLSITAYFMACSDSQKDACYFGNTPQGTDSCMNTVYKSEDYTIPVLTGKDLPYIYGYHEMNKRPIMDSDSIPLFNYNEKNYYHPVYLAQYALEMLDIYTTKPNLYHLSEMEKIAAKLVDISEMKDSSMLFPYTYDYYVHGCTQAKMTKNWYSGLAQGQVLSLFSRLYSLTKKEIYLKNAQNVFNSLKRLKGNKVNHWSACIDSKSNLWFEEFPSTLPFHTLNGMIYTLYGLYDYYLITQNSECKRLLQGGIFTIKSNLKNFRNKNGAIYYCLGHKVVAEDYQAIHIDQFRKLYNISNDSAFIKAITVCSTDYKKFKQLGKER